jgi:hypothetical protein
MNEHQRHVRLPAIFSAGSFLCLVAIVSFTSPLMSISYAALFFFILLVFLVSFGSLIVHFRSGQLTKRKKYRIFIVSFFILSILMFSSAQSLNPLNLFVLGLIVTGMLFYSGRRV